MWMRYIVTPSPTITTKLRDGALVLRNKQVWLSDSIGHGQTWDIFNLDTIIKDHNISLRSMLMQIISKEDNKQLFMGINKDRFDDKHYITFKLSRESEAHNMVVEFCSYLIFKYSDAIITSLTIPASMCASSAPWDIVLHCKIP